MATPNIPEKMVLADLESKTPEQFIEYCFKNGSFNKELFTHSINLLAKYSKFPKIQSFTGALKELHPGIHTKMTATQSESYKNIENTP